MDRTTALELLKSASPHDRLKAARFIARTAVPADLAPVRQALQTESVSYVKQALRSALKRGTPDRAPVTLDSNQEPQISDSVRRAVYNKAVQEVTATLLHEIAPLVGVALAEVAKDLPSSRAHEKLERLKSVLEAISDLRKAAASMHAGEFDISAMLRQLVNDEGLSRGVPVDLEGRSPFLINGDPTLLGLAVSNGLRNALDANLESRSDRHVVVNWGETDVEYWVSVLDGGRGLLGTTEQAFAIGNTTKKDHLGFGLAIARQAMDTVAGVVRLANGASGGALFEVRWCK